MPALTPCQLLIDPPAEGAWNMAVDEVLLNAAAQSGLPTLRFYQWQRPTLSLGYFQKAADRTMHSSSLAADVVRRLSGGGAILHDQELTYSLILPAAHTLSRDTQSLYNAVHQAIITTLNHCLAAAQSSWRAEPYEQSAGLNAGDEPFLCFQRRSAGDILLGDKTADPEVLKLKIVGSAQRRRQGVVLQHGSILLRPSRVAPELQGISGITHVIISPTDLLDQLPDRLAKELSFDLTEYSLPTEIARKARELQEHKYQAANWTERR